MLNSGEIGKCGTQYIEYLIRKGEKIEKPLVFAQDTIITTNFIVYYDPAEVSQAYAESTASYFEHAWGFQVNTLGWDAPPIDPSVGYYEVIIEPLPSGILGVTYRYAEGPDPNQEDWYSYIKITTGMNWNYLRTTVSHEFNHACQFSYTGSDGIWIYENTATWMEDMEYDNIDQYQEYLSGTSPIKNPWLNITSTQDLYEYAGCLFPMFLSEWLNDPDVMRKIWDLMGVHLGNNALRDIDSILKIYYGENLEDALIEYAEWRFFTGFFNDNTHFEEAGDWPNPSINSHNSYPANGDNSGKLIREPGGAFFVWFTNVGGEKLEIDFQGEWVEGRIWNVRIVEREGSPPYPEWDMNLVQGSGIDTSDGGANQIYVIAVDAKWKGTLYFSVDLSYSADIVSDVEERVVDKKYSTDVKLSFIFNGIKLTNNSLFPVLTEIYASSGRKLKSFILNKEKVLNKLPVGEYFIVFNKSKKYKFFILR